ncbi:hypothetical protein ACRCUN_26585 [Mycobacterium sp. LTG2003]
MVTHPASTSCPPRTGGRHRRPPERRWLPIGIGVAATALVSSLLTAFVVFTTLAAKLSSRDSTYAVGAKMLAVNPDRTPRHRATEQPGTATVSPFAFDQSGFIGSGARCRDTQTARAIGRTEGSLVVICLDRAGRFEYHGVRLTDEAALAATAQKSPDRKFVARNYSVSYAVSPTELLVTSGNTVIKREPMVEYREILSTPVVVAPR